MVNVLDETLLVQFGYRQSENAKTQLKRVIKNTKGFEHIGKHLLALNDNLKPFDSYVTLSSTHDYFKIKNEGKDEEEIEKVNTLIKKWTDKYKVKLQKVEGKETYYIIGVL